MKVRYGLQFADTVHDAFIELLCAFRYREEPYASNRANMLPPAKHLLTACRLLFTKSEFGISRWTEEHAEDFCTRDFVITWGSSSCSKSNDYGLYCLLFWLTAPHETGVTIITTTKDMALYRSYEAVQRYFSILKSNNDIAVPGKEDKQRMAITLDDTDLPPGLPATRKGSLRCLPIVDGSESHAVTRAAGAHSPYSILLLDELDGLSPVAMKLRVNQSIGASKRFACFALSNPVSKTNWTSKYCEPLAGWASVTPEDDKWETHYGLLRRHDGLKSPAIDNPDEYPYLINKAQIDLIRRQDGEDSPEYWRMVRGFPGENDLESTVLTPAMIQAHEMSQPVIWNDGDHVRHLVAGLDPAFTSGGDGCVLQFGEVGVSNKQRPTLLFTDTVQIHIEASSQRPATYQIVDRVREELASKGMSPRMLCVDDSGTQSVADVLDVELGVKVLRANFAARATEDPLSIDSAEKAVDKYRNIVTQIWMLVQFLGRYGHLRGLPASAAEQFCLRRFKRTASHLLALESKQEFKKRLAGRRSPDEGDALALCAFAAMRLVGLTPGNRTLPDRPPETYGYQAPSIVNPKQLVANYSVDSMASIRINSPGYLGTGGARSFRF